MDDLFHKHNIQVNYCWSSSNTETIKEAVACNLGISVLSSLVIQKEVDEGRFVALPIEDEALSRQIALIYHKNKFLSKLMQEFISICKSFK